MRVTLLGHASVLVELDGATCLMDPVLADPFEEGTVASCPQRTIVADKLPPIDILVVSHRHPDHFDLASLARIDRRADAICPADPLIVYALEELGFEAIHPVHPMAPIVGDGFELFPTRSELPSIPEMGCVFHDRTGTFWNQVDTPLATATIDAVRERFSGVDLLFAMYASQNFEFFESLTTRFPAETHQQNLEAVVHIAPRTVVPASAGFRFCGSHEWLNAFLFPISRGRFVDDLRAVSPRTDTVVMNPGDVIDLDGEHIRHRPGASELARTEVDDTWRIAFDPTAAVPPLRDDNPDGYSDSDIAAATRDVILDGVAGYVEEDSGSDDRLLAAYASHRATYRVDIVFPDDHVSWHRFDFGHEPPRVTDGSGAGPPSDLVHRIAASALTGWSRHARSFFSVRASSRRAGAVHHPTRAGDDVRLEPRPLPDLLMYYLLRKAKGSELAGKYEVDHQLQLLQNGTPRGARDSGSSNA
jgi:L-ascorbate metabolism protein UlaG (beta-lactamase superfamily)